MSANTLTNITGALTAIAGVTSVFAQSGVPNNATGWLQVVTYLAAGLSQYFIAKPGAVVPTSPKV